MIRNRKDCIRISHIAHLYFAFIPTPFYDNGNQPSILGCLYASSPTSAVAASVIIITKFGAVAADIHWIYTFVHLSVPIARKWALITIMPVIQQIKKYPSRVGKSIALYSSMATLGLSLGVAGPTMLDLGILVQDKVDIAYILPGRAGGYAIGSFLGLTFFPSFSSDYLLPPPSATRHPSSHLHRDTITLPGNKEETSLCVLLLILSGSNS